MVELRTPDLRLPVALDRAPRSSTPSRPSPARRRRRRAFFAEQRRVADLLWALFDDPSLLPPFDAASLGRHALRSARYLGLLLPLLGRPLGALLDKHGVAGFGPLRACLDRSLCQDHRAIAPPPRPRRRSRWPRWITAGAARAMCAGGSACWRGALSDAVARLGGSVHLATSVKSGRPADGGATSSPPGAARCGRTPSSPTSSRTRCAICSAWAKAR
ncbi:MAG: hypothetical protein U0359_13430 [Byssovorax sp.]